MRIETSKQFNLISKKMFGKFRDIETISHLLYKCARFKTLLDQIEQLSILWKFFYTAGENPDIVDVIFLLTKHEIHKSK